jgi:hypothetical protein
MCDEVPDNDYESANFPYRKDDDPGALCADDPAKVNLRDRAAVPTGLAYGVPSA